MNRLSNAIAILLLGTTTALANDETQACDFTPGSPDSCVRFVGCINNEEAHFYGTSVGWSSGTVYGLTSEGNLCEGAWQNDEEREKGVGTLNCTSGENAEFRYFRRGENFAVLSGVAISSKGRRMITWAGHDLEGYLKEKFPDGDHPGFQCGDTWIKLPGEFPMLSK